ncbi:thiamine pyrophosphate-binding protein [Novosphingobium mangrovi (ex Huang et al. 2023)]|uniref:Thiamine pyrophosphate-binding protein n=1 Tax=Novosphingobium mangrovi (ex Huang et al. 2023) TaxID=2976432 RepID=A0ABT2I604_9SPHN|nr:thiamine pyrophosphate-binding protein [Novosphingobium mangrovi (ex Huang et al. 2023)]MCT2400237.1 thiamine pyrophosphate-binding protein [Novosphingobium mangrovi (ex Huang et al. 2023)]
MTQTIQDRILDLVQAENIDTLFGIPDPSFFGLFIEAEKRGIEIVSPHHEQAAALTADGHFRMTGKPAVLCVNKGPGVANIAAGANFLRKENVPAVFIMAQRQRFYEQRVRRGKMQYMSQPPMFDGVMKYVGVVEYPEQLDEIFHEAFRQAVSGVPGPTYIELPLGIMQAKFDLPPAPPPHRYRMVRQRADDLGIAEAVELLRGAKNPALLLGQGGFVSRAHDMLGVLAAKLSCPILLSNAVEAVLPGMEDRTFAYSSDAGAQIAAQSDVVLAIGTELGEALNYGRGHAWKEGDATRKWIYIERDALAIGVNRPIDVPLVGDLRDVVPQLTEALGDLQRDLPAKLPEWTALRDSAKKALEDRIPTTSCPIHTGRVAIEATRALPEDTILVRDGGASSMWFSALLQFTPRDAMWSSNWGAIGNGLPMALGAQLAVGDKRRVALLTGDSAFLFHISELETAVRKNLPLICIVAVDHAWGIEAASYKANFGDNTPTPEARWGNSVRLDLTAQSFGAYGEYVDKAEDIAPAVERALASGKPAVIHVEVDQAANSTFAGIPGFLEFRNWFGEEGDFLGVPGAAPAPTAGGGGSTENSSGY